MTRRRLYDIVFTLALFALYTTMALVLVAIGARVYLATSDTMTTNYNERTSVLYVAQRLRQNDVYGQVRVEHLNGSDALVFSETIGDDTYETWLYVFDDQLCEILVARGSQADLRYGQRIMPMQSMTVDTSRLSDGLISVRFMLEDGQPSQIDIYLKSIDTGGIQ